ncbi:hypothetical protein Syun_029023 [Stephania yunnanensis]|uniref:Major facilitator superfamily (MFS) profile domain-containing protein n=1 Tax=Stephania yunnanensis TaxID=152371 RepID=A0AAP0E4T6_9MAGN
MGLSSIFCIVRWLAVYFSKGVIALDLGRVCNGFGIGLISYTVCSQTSSQTGNVIDAMLFVRLIKELIGADFFAEIAPKTLRGALTTLNQLMIVTGISVTFIVGTLVSWRTLAAIGILPCFLLLVGLFIVPESPRWLAKVGRKKEFEFALRRFRGKDADISEEAAEIQEYIETIQDLPRVRVLDLLERRYLLSVTVGVGLMVFQQFGGINGINFYATNIFKSAGFPSNIGTIIFARIQLPFTFLGAILSDRVGRRPLLFFSASGMLIGCILLATCFYMKVHDSSSGFVAILALTGILTYIGTYSVGMGGVPWVMVSEIFPINVKGTAGSLVTLVNWFGSWAVSFTFNFLMSWSSCDWLFFSY